MANGGPNENVKVQHGHQMDYLKYHLACDVVSSHAAGSQRQSGLMLQILGLFRIMGNLHARSVECQIPEKIKSAL